MFLFTGYWLVSIKEQEKIPNSGQYGTSSSRGTVEHLPKGGISQVCTCSRHFNMRDSVWWGDVCVDVCGGCARAWTHMCMCMCMRRGRGCPLGVYALELY